MKERNNLAVLEQSLIRGKSIALRSVSRSLKMGILKGSKGAFKYWLENMTEGSATLSGLRRRLEISELRLIDANDELKRSQNQVEKLEARGQAQEYLTKEKFGLKEAQEAENEAVENAMMETMMDLETMEEKLTAANKAREAALKAAKSLSMELVKAEGAVKAAEVAKEEALSAKQLVEEAQEELIEEGLRKDEGSKEELEAKELVLSATMEEVSALKIKLKDTKKQHNDELSEFQLEMLDEQNQLKENLKEKDRELSELKAQHLP